MIRFLALGTWPWTRTPRRTPVRSLAAVLPPSSFLLCFSILFPLVSGTNTRAADWPQFRGPNRDGHTSGLPAALGEMEPAWTKPLSGPTHAGIVVADGRVVLCDHGDGRDLVRCFDAGTGEAKWSYAVPNKEEMPYNAAPRATPLLHEGKVYVLTALGRLICLKLEDGTLAWELDFVKRYQGEVPNWGYCASPLVVDGRLIATPLGKEIGLVALEPTTGKPVWETKCVGARHGSYIVGSFGGVKQIVGYDGENCAGFEVTSGRRLWSIEPEVAGDFCVGTPVAAGDRVLYSTDTNTTRLFAFGPNGTVRGEPVAMSERLLPDMGTPVYLDGFLYGSGPDFVCLDAGDLKLKWSDANEKALQGLTFLLAGSGRILVFREDGSAALIEAHATGLKVLGRAKLCGKTWSHPALANGRLYVRDAKQLYCYEWK